MNEPITEKQYPIRFLWSIKPMAWGFVGFFIYGLFTSVSTEVINKYNPTVTSIENNAIHFPWFVLTIFYAFLGAFLASPISIFHFFSQKFFHYSFEENHLVLSQGIITRQERYIPYNVIQNILTKQGFFDKIFKLKTLVIENASQGAGVKSIKTNQQSNESIVGFHENKVFISGLKNSEAEIIKELVLRKIKENPIRDSKSGL